MKLIPLTKETQRWLPIVVLAIGVVSIGVLDMYGASQRFGTGVMVATILLFGSVARRVWKQ